MRENNEWIKELNVGDEIAVDVSNVWHKNAYKRVTVTKVTPTGRIKTSDGNQYYADGRKIGGNSSFSPLKQLTPEIVELIERRELLNGLKFDEFVDLLSSERLQTLREWQKELISK